MKIHTSTVRYAGRDRLDVTVKSGDKVFAPTWDMVMGYKKGSISWEEYTRQYTALMRQSYARNTARWLEVLAQDEVTLVCYCRDDEECHRRLLAEMLAAVARKHDIPVEVCGER